MSNNYNMHSIKRMAHREAWYGNSSNPFRKTHTGFGQLRERDIENQDGGDTTRVLSEPPPRTSGFSNDETRSPSSKHRPADSEKFEMTSGNGEASRREQSSEQTAVEATSAGKRPPSVEQSARQRFISRFHKKKHDEEMQGSSTNSSDDSKPKKKFTFASQIRATIFNSWINILILAAPVGIALHYTNQTPWAVFIVNFVAIIPLAAMLSYATEEIAIRVGETLGGLLNATFGNAVELIVSILALLQKEYIIVKTSLIGSMLSNLLLVMGMCFFFGGLRRTEQFFNVTVAQTAASLLALAIASVIIPTAFDISTTTTSVPIAEISRGTAVILLLVYGCYLFFQLKTHQALYMEESKKVPMRPRKHKMTKGGISKAVAQAGGLGAAQGRTHPVDMDIPPEDEIMQRDAYEQKESRDKEEKEEPQLTLTVALATLAISTAIIAFCAESMVSSIDAVTGPGSAVTKEFVGLILLPIVGNAAEHATAVTVACKDKMDLAIGVAVGSSMQIALFVLPFIVVVGWGLQYDDMNLSFDGFQVAVLFVSVLLVNYLIADGKSHWLEGALLQSLYLIIAVTAWFYPNQPGE